MTQTLPRFAACARRAAYALFFANFASAVSCYAPDQRDCVLACGPEGACPDGMQCSLGLCAKAGVDCSRPEPQEQVADPCEPGTRRCGAPGSVELCDEETRSFRLDVTCGEPSPACHDARCAECAPGARRCDGEGAVVECGEDARWGSSTPCREPFGVCVAGSCSAPTRVIAGESHACAVTSERSFCWGDDSYGQLGSGSSRDGFVEFDPATPVGTVSVGGAHTCALLVDGSVVCWGDGTVGQLGTGVADFSEAPVTVDLGAGLAVDVASGVRHSCALLDDGRVKCWGGNEFGQLGLGDVDARGDQAEEMGMHLPAVDLGPGSVAVQLSAGANHTCVVLSDGTARCWGANEFGQLGVWDTRQRGDDPLEMGSSLEAVNLPDAARVTQLSAGGRHTCAVLENGRATCWGRGGAGQLGTGDTVSRGDDASLPLEYVELGTGLAPLHVEAGGNHSCATLRDEDGVTRLKCWGGNASGELGLGSTMTVGGGGDMLGDNLRPIDCGALDGVPLEPVLVTAGDAFSCAVFAAGGAKCWGNNDVGQLGFVSESRAVGDAPGEMGDALPFLSFE